MLLHSLIPLKFTVSGLAQKYDLEFLNASQNIFI